jgi:hypothetical protein
MAKNKKSGKGLNVSIMPYGEIANLDSAGRIKKILNIILAGKVVILQGKLRPEEESRLIEDTMALIGHVKGFKGIELAVLATESLNWREKFRNGIARVLVGNRDAMTVIGPASIVKGIKKDPRKLEVMLK